MQLYRNQFYVFWADTPINPPPLAKPARRHADAEGREVPGWMVHFAFDRNAAHMALIVLAAVDLHRYHEAHDKGPIRWGWTAYRGGHTTVLVKSAPSNLAAYLAGDESRIPVQWGDLSIDEATMLELMLRRGVAQYMALLRSDEYEAVFTSVVIP